MKLPLHSGEATNADGQKYAYDAPLQGSNRNYDTGIGTTNIRQVEFDSGEWQTVSGEFRIY